MGPKKKGGKKGKKKADKEEKEQPEEPSEYDTMDTTMLNEVIQMLQQQLEKAHVDRNYVQHERDTIESFYEITKQEIKDHENEIYAKDREMELMEENHRVEVRVYIQKVKHLEFEHKSNLKRLEKDETIHLQDEKQIHEIREGTLRQDKKSLRLEVNEQELYNENEIDQLKQAHEKNLLKLREQFEKNLSSLHTRCEDQLQELQQHLELRRKVHIHEIEERKNLHINDLMKNHEKAFTQIQTYYNDITKDNLRLIDTLKHEIQAMKKKAIVNTKLMHDISVENRRLSEPLSLALQEVQRLRHELKDEKKDHLSLRNAKARLSYLTKQVMEMKQQIQELKGQYKQMESDRNTLYDTFEQTIQTIHKKGECKNLILEQRLETMQEQHYRKDQQLNEILLAANLDQAQAQYVTETLNRLLNEKNMKIQDLQYIVAKDSKKFNDTLRTFTEKLVEFGIPEEEIRQLGFTPFPYTATSIPAGLVAKE